MDRNEKNSMKAEIGEYIDLSNGRYKDFEIEKLHDLVKNRDEYNGMSKTHYHEGKGFDSEDTYRFVEKDTYTLQSDDTGIHIDRKLTVDYDDGTHDDYGDDYTTGRDILNHLDKLF